MSFKVRCFFTYLNSCQLSYNRNDSNVISRTCIYYNYISGFFSYHKAKAATVLGALASVIIFGSLLIIWGAWRNTALINLDKGMFHLSQANSARARIISEPSCLGRR